MCDRRRLQTRARTGRLLVQRRVALRDVRAFVARLRAARRRQRLDVDEEAEVARLLDAAKHIEQATSRQFVDAIPSAYL